MVARFVKDRTISRQRDHGLCTNILGREYPIEKNVGLLKAITIHFGAFSGTQTTVSKTLGVAELLVDLFGLSKVEGLLDSKLPNHPYTEPSFPAFTPLVRNVGLANCLFGACVHLAWYLTSVVRFTYPPRYSALCLSVIASSIAGSAIFTLGECVLRWRQCEKCQAFAVSSVMWAVDSWGSLEMTLEEAVKWVGMVQQLATNRKLRHLECIENTLEKDVQTSSLQCKGLLTVTHHSFLFLGEVFKKTTEALSGGPCVLDCCVKIKDYIHSFRGPDLTELDLLPEVELVDVEEVFSTVQERLDEIVLRLLFIRLESCKSQHVDQKWFLEVIEVFNTVKDAVDMMRRSVWKQLLQAYSPLQSQNFDFIDMHEALWPKLVRCLQNELQTTLTAPWGGPADCDSSVLQKHLVAAQDMLEELRTLLAEQSRRKRQGDCNIVPLTMSWQEVLQNTEVIESTGLHASPLVHMPPRLSEEAAEEVPDHLEELKAVLAVRPPQAEVVKTLHMM